ncbi:MAG: hypothetical protein HKN73_09390 [Gemmatimonadetes bacterium]|nr:hypothetical protein [Gemmatimonadota bacterium]
MIGPLARAARQATRSFRPLQLGLIARDLLPPRPSGRSDLEQLRDAIDWLCLAHDAGGGEGVAAGYYPSHGGWLEPYPETTGYIIPTFLKARPRLERDDLLPRAVAMGDWEIREQLPDGAVRGGVGLSGPPIVFNTGQVMLGWIALHRETGEGRFADAALRAGRWLAHVQDESGAWTRFTHEGVPHAYHTRVAWPVLATAEMTGDPALKAAGRRHVAWVLDQTGPGGWIRHMGFTEDEAPLTHTIAYTLRGLLECIPHVPEQDGHLILHAVQEACGSIGRLLDRGTDRLALPGQLAEGWRPAARYACVTGNAQLAIVFMGLHRLGPDPRWERAARRLLDDVCARQVGPKGRPEVRGAVPGSYPCWGRYNPLSFPNWATKFFADALLDWMEREGAPSRDSVEGLDGALVG